MRLKPATPWSRIKHCTTEPAPEPSFGPVYARFGNKWVKIQNFQNRELEKFKFNNLQYAWKIVTISNLNGQMASDKLIIIEKLLQFV